MGPLRVPSKVNRSGPSLFGAPFKIWSAQKIDNTNTFCTESEGTVLSSTVHTTSAETNGREVAMSSSCVRCSSGKFEFHWSWDCGRRGRPLSARHASLARVILSRHLCFFLSWSAHVTEAASISRVLGACRRRRASSKDSEAQGKSPCMRFISASSSRTSEPASVTKVPAACWTRSSPTNDSDGLI